MHAATGRPTARTRARTPATPQTPFVIFSASKAMTAVVAHLLDERGLLHVDDRVCEYIPEYAAHGKEAITIEHLLSHRAGVPNLPADAFDLDRFGDRDVPAGDTVRGQAPLAPREAALLPRRLGRLHHRRDRPARNRQGHPHGAGGRRSWVRSTFAGATTA